MTDRRLPSEAEVQSWIRERNNWGRWGRDDQRGTINLITPAKRVEAARLCRTGRSVSLSRPFPKEPGTQSGRSPSTARPSGRSSTGARGS